MILNPYGEIIQQCYWDLEHKYPNIECCEYVIMPNHFHAIIKIDRDAFRAGEPRPYVVTLGHIVGYIRGNTKSKTNYTYDIDIQQIKEDRKKYEKSQCFPFASHFGLKRG